MKIINRAKAIDGTGGYIISQSIKFENEKMFLYSIPFRQWVECDESTRSINFEDMLDSQRNKIFASLSENGKGGDIIETELKRVCTVKYKEYFFYADNKDYHCNCFGFIHSKTIGIQQ